jgi:hypothetical protein
MGSVLGISGLSDRQEEALIKMAKYYFKASVMISHYKNAKSMAIDNYKAFATNTDRQTAYENAWNKYMIKDYETKMTNAKDRVAAWVQKYVKQMFNISLTPEQAKSYAETIIAKMTTGT